MVLPACLSLTKHNENSRDIQHFFRELLYIFAKERFCSSLMFHWLFFSPNSPRMTSSLEDLPKACNKTTKEKEAISLDKRWQEGEEAVGGHADEEALSSAHFVRHPSPEERSNHHPQVNNTAWRIQGEGSLFSLQTTCYLTSHVHMLLWVCTFSYQ